MGIRLEREWKRRRERGRKEGQERGKEATGRNHYLYST